MTYRCFDVEIANHIAHIKLKRAAELNTMVPEFWTELPAIVTDIDDHAKARVIVISSTGKTTTVTATVKGSKAAGRIDATIVTNGGKTTILILFLHTPDGRTFDIAHPPPGSI